MSQGVRFALVLLCFFLSGFAALIYQTADSLDRMLGIKG